MSESTLDAIAHRPSSHRPQRPIHQLDLDQALWTGNLTVNVTIHTSLSLAPKGLSRLGSFNNHPTSLAVNNRVDRNRQDCGSSSVGYYRSRANHDRALDGMD